jgi:predicted O-methyltransferase YrrM
LNQYLNERETALLIDLVANVSPKVMIEIGCNEGRTAATLLKSIPTIERYIGIDVPPDYIPTLSCQRSEVPEYPGQRVENGSRFYLLIAEAGSLSLEPRDLEPCDAVFVDGDHSRQAVLHDAALALALCRAGGIIVFHDYNNPAVEVTEALNELRDKEGWSITVVENSWLAFRRV